MAWANQFLFLGLFTDSGQLAFESRFRLSSPSGGVGAPMSPRDWGVRGLRRSWLPLCCLAFEINQQNDDSQHTLPVARAGISLRYLAGSPIRESMAATEPTRLF